MSPWSSNQNDSKKLYTFKRYVSSRCDHPPTEILFVKVVSDLLRINISKNTPYELKVPEIAFYVKVTVPVLILDV